MILQEVRGAFLKKEASIWIEEAKHRPIQNAFSEFGTKENFVFYLLILIRVKVFWPCK
jgi:hypothetical protein